MASKMNDSQLFHDEKVVLRYMNEFPFGNYFIARDIVECFAERPSKNPTWYNPNNYGQFKVVQFWDTPDVPTDVARMIAKNQKWCGEHRHSLFNLDSARNFIIDHLPERVIQAFDFCHHPSMKSDIFRLAYLLIVGGLYVDADNEILGGFNVEQFRPNQLVASAGIRANKSRPDGSWEWHSLSELVDSKVQNDVVCYLHNDVIASGAGNEVIRLALARSVLALEQSRDTGIKARAHTATGPTNLTVAAIMHVIRTCNNPERACDILIFDRDPCTKGGTFEYKKDARNWIVAEA